MIIKMLKRAGEFGENKDIAKVIRIKSIMPALVDNEPVILDFEGMTGVTQSFIHALIVDPMRQFSDTFFDLVAFKNCNEDIKQIIRIVFEYTQESLEEYTNN